MPLPQLLSLRPRAPLKIMLVRVGQVDLGPILVAPGEKMLAGSLAAQGLVLKETVPSRRGDRVLVVLLRVAVFVPKRRPLGAEQVDHVNAVDAALLHELLHLRYGRGGPSPPLPPREPAAAAVVVAPRQRQRGEALEEHDATKGEGAVETPLQRGTLGVHPPGQVVLAEVVREPHPVHLDRVVDAQVSSLRRLLERLLVAHDLAVHGRAVDGAAHEGLAELPRDAHEDDHEVLVVLLHLRDAPGEVGLQPVEGLAGVQRQIHVHVGAKAGVLDLSRQHPDPVAVAQRFEGQVLVQDPVIHERVQQHEHLGLEVAGVRLLHHVRCDLPELVRAGVVLEEGGEDDRVRAEAVAAVRGNAVLDGIAKHLESDDRK
mmetsp:Transcript_40106/g.74103  ORF Transcript_40106/g.74103 Transcript_40106/m.74103 type:complete len:372 (-) Transcript_40106:548-1663(-)